jgi:hypothetical protein
MGHHRPFTPAFFGLAIEHRAGLTPRLDTEPPGSRRYFPTLHRNRSRAVALSFVAQWRITPLLCHVNMVPCPASISRRGFFCEPPGPRAGGPWQGPAASAFFRKSGPEMLTVSLSVDDPSLP